MSWSRFRNNMIEKMNNYPYEDNNGFAQALADEYDKCMKSGSDIVNKNRLKVGNKSAFQAIIEAQQAEIRDRIAKMEFQISTLAKILQNE